MQYIPIHISNLVELRSFPADLYLIMPSEKVVCIARAGRLLESGKIAEYKKKGIQHLYFKKEDFKDILDSVSSQYHLIDNVYSRAPESRNYSEWCKQTKNIENELLDCFLEEEVYLLMTILDRSAFWSFSSCKFEKLLVDYFSLSLSFYRERVLCGFFSLYFFYKKEGLRVSDLIILALSTLLMDVGKVKLPLEVILSQEKDLSDDEKVIYKSISEVTLNLIGESENISNDVLKLISKSHEKTETSGFSLGDSLEKSESLYLALFLGTSVCEFLHLSSEPVTKNAFSRALDNLKVNGFTL